MSVEIGAGSTDASDYEIMQSALGDPEQIKKRKEVEALTLSAYSDMEGSLITKETCLLELERLNVEKRNNPRFLKLHQHHYNRVKEELQKAEDKIHYLKSDKEVSDRRRSNALKALYEYEGMTPEKRRRVYGQRYPIEVLLGYKREWEL